MKVAGQQVSIISTLATLYLRSFAIQLTFGAVIAQLKGLSNP